MRMPTLIPLFALLAACAGATGGRGVVVPYENGRFVATALARSEEHALRDAVAAARAECEGRRQQLAVVRERTEYQGIVAREVVKTAQQLEEILATGGVVPDLGSDEDYKVSIEFRCAS